MSRPSVSGGIVDSHVHILPEPLASKIRAFFEAHLPGPLVYDTEPRSIVEQLASAGVTSAWTLPYAHRPGIADDLNRAMVALVAELADGPVELIAGLTVHPADADPARTVSHAIGDLGSKVLKLHCSVGDFSLTDPRLAGVWEVAAASRLPVVLHLGRNVSGRTAARDLAGLSRVADAHPSVPLIVAHCGHPATDEVLDLMRRHPNLYADLTPVVVEPVLLEVESVEELHTRILLGTDAPSTGLDASDVISAVVSRYSAAAAAAIMGANARRLLSNITP